jgi:gliding motility-associated-like protein
MTLSTAALLFFINAASAQSDVLSHLGPFEQQARVLNPLREPFNINTRPTPVAADIDKDGDVDVMVADFYGGNGFHFFRNDGTSTSPAFERTLGWANPFAFYNFDPGASPTFTDLDGDHDLDMLLGVMDGTFRYYKKTETTYPYTHQTGAWNAGTKNGNPFYGIDLGDYASPAFMDMDNDGDDDAVVGTSYAPNNKSIHYFINDGTGNFTAGTLNGINPVLEEVTPAFIDFDKDGDEDLLLGAEDGNLYYYKRTGVTSFEEQTGSANPFNGVNKGLHSSPSVADFDNDGDEDVILGSENTGQDIAYFRNTGNGIFEELTSFANPFGGVDTGSDSSPYFADIDTDGDQDIIIGNTNGSLTLLNYYRNDSGSYTEETVSNPFANLEIPRSFVPSFVDLDGDGDKDLAGSVSNTESSVEYYKNENGVFVHQSFATGPFRHVVVYEGKSDFADIDNDGDLDLFLSDGNDEVEPDDHFIRFYKNTGTAQSPVFTELTGAENPLYQVREEFVLFPRFTDIDHDGDLDVIIGEGGDVIEISDGNEFSYYENTGTVDQPVFKYRGDLIQQGTNPYEPAPSFVDQDNDGDLDMFIGNSSGSLFYYKNTNPAAVVTLNTSPLLVSAEAGPVFIDSELTLSDADNDSIVWAQVSIGDFHPGEEELLYTLQAPVTGVFDAVTGVLTLKGKATVALYQDILRSVRLKYSSELSSGRTDGEHLTVSKTITVRISDADGTASVAAARVVTIVSGQAPVFTDATITAKAKGIATIDLTKLISDGDDDVDVSTLIVQQLPASGAATSITAGIFSIDYSTLNFTGTDFIIVQVCDLNGNCDQSVIAVSVLNASPVFNDHTQTIAFGGTVNIDLTSLVSDPDGNIDLTTLEIIQNTVSGAVAAINSHNQLVIDYSGVNFSGMDHVNVRICDAIGVCSQSTIQIVVVNAPPVIQPAPVSTPQGSTKTLNLLDITFDPDGNLDPSKLEVVQHPLSGAGASISFISATEVNLTLDYSGVTFSGMDQLTIRACDNAGACTESVISIEVDVTSELEIFNAVSQNNDGSNDFLFLRNIRSFNRVSIYNRWGDTVFEIENYDNDIPGRRFEGFNNSGTQLPTGTYYYKIEYGLEVVATGFLSLKH